MSQREPVDVRILVHDEQGPDSARSQWLPPFRVRGLVIVLERVGLLDRLGGGVGGCQRQRDRDNCKQSCSDSHDSFSRVAVLAYHDAALETVVVVNAWLGTAWPSRECPTSNGTPRGNVTGKHPVIGVSLATRRTWPPDAIVVSTRCGDKESSLTNVVSGGRSTIHPQRVQRPSFRKLFVDRDLAPCSEPGIPGRVVGIASR